MILYIILGVSAVSMISAGCARAAIDKGTLIKGSESTVYYVDENGGRFVFPNSTTFKSWFQTDPPAIIKVSDSQLEQLPLMGNVTIRPGVYLIKIQTDPRVYAVSAGGYLHWITSENIAKALYGNDWNKKVVDVPDVFFTNYMLDTPIGNAAAYDKNQAMNGAPDIQIDLDSHFSFSGDKWMNSEQKRSMFSLTNLFESGEVHPSYSTVEHLDDGRGYTSGRSGFTTATGDAYAVVKLYTQKKPDNPLAKYLSHLKTLADQTSDSLAGLEGYDSAWQKAALDPVFRQVQDQINDELYYLPAMRKADLLNLQSALGRAFLYDTIIQHGEGNDADGFDAIIDRTNDNVGQNPRQGADETEWLYAIFEERQKTLNNATNPDTRDVWAESAYRVNVYRTLLDQKNYALTTPFRVRESWINEVIE